MSDSEVIDEACLSSVPPDSFAASKFLISSEVRCNDCGCKGSMVVGASILLDVEAMIATMGNQGQSSACE